VLENLGWNWEVFEEKVSNLGMHLPLDNKLGYVNWAVDPPQRTQEEPEWTRNMWFLKHAVEGGDKSWPSLMWLCDNGVRPMKGHAIYVIAAVAGNLEAIKHFKKREETGEEWHLPRWLSDLSNGSV
jgi:hypothetical protein